MTTPRTRRALTALLAAAACLALTAVAFASDGEAPLSNMYATFWGLVPPIVAIVLALITKEAYSSLFIGILVGALFQCNFATFFDFSFVFSVFCIFKFIGSTCTTRFEFNFCS